jgi:hypothetical protein
VSPTIICRKVPLFLNVAGYHTARDAALVWRSDRPGVATFSTDRWPVDVTIDGLHAGLGGVVYVEPFGGRTIRPVHDGPRLWVRIDLELSDGTFAELAVFSGRVIEFLADVMIAVALGDEGRTVWESEHLPRELRKGGAA